MFEKRASFILVSFLIIIIERQTVLILLLFIFCYGLLNCCVILFHIHAISIQSIFIILFSFFVFV